MYWIRCYNCEDGYSHHECGEDTCVCLNPQPNVICDICGGKGGWKSPEPPRDSDIQYHEIEN